MMRIEAMVVCVNYGDLLELTLPTMLQHVDDLYVITTEDDKDTLYVVENQEADESTGTMACVCTTDAFYRGGDAFNKGRAIQEFIECGLFRFDDWVLSIDADIVLPSNARTIIEKEVTDKRKLYGMPALVCPTPEMWAQVMLPDCTWRTDHLSRRPLPNETPGYFQLWHSSALEQPWFEKDWGHAGGYDSIFQRRFEDRPRISQSASVRRSWLSTQCIHLGEPRENWFGRQSKRWSAYLQGHPVGPTHEQIADADRCYREMRRSGTMAHKAKMGKISTDL